MTVLVAFAWLIVVLVLCKYYFDTAIFGDFVKGFCLVWWKIITKDADTDIDRNIECPAFALAGFAVGMVTVAITLIGVGCLFYESFQWASEFDSHERLHSGSYRFLGNGYR